MFESHLGRLTSLKKRRKYAISGAVVLPCTVLMYPKICNQIDMLCLVSMCPKYVCRYVCAHLLPTVLSLQVKVVCREHGLIHSSLVSCDLTLHCHPLWSWPVYMHMYIHIMYIQAVLRSMYMHACTCTCVHVCVL